MDKEIRNLPVELRVEGDGEGKKIVGHAAVFDVLSEDFGGWREKIARGAFAEAIGRDDVRALFNHDANFVLGRNRSGTLQLSEDATGLAIEIDPPDTQWARDLMTSMSRGDIDQMSFSFTVESQTWEELDTGDIRTINKIKRLYDVSPVTYPAYAETDVALREFRAWIETKQKPEPNTDENLGLALRLTELEC